VTQPTDPLSERIHALIAASLARLAPGYAWGLALVPREDS
jgi:hypothetical protein